MKLISLMRVTAISLCSSVVFFSSLLLCMQDQSLGMTMSQAQKLGYPQTPNPGQMSAAQFEHLTLFAALCEISKATNPDEITQEPCPLPLGVVFSPSIEPIPQEQEMEGLYGDTQPTQVEKFSCYHCGYQANDSRRLIDHIRAIHEKLKPYKCDYCPFETAYNYSRAKHEEQRHPEKMQYHCTFDGCFHASLTEERLTKHAKIHHLFGPETTFSADQPQPSQLSEYSNAPARKPRKKSYLCSLCQQLIVGYHDLLEHKKSHKRARPAYLDQITIGSHADHW